MTAATTGAATTDVVALDLEIARFLYREAALLDDRRWDDWLALWAEDGHYSVPIRRDVEGDDSWGRPVEECFGGPGELHYVDEPFLVASVRVAKLKTGKAWAEQPPSHTTRLITNVHVLDDPDGEPDGDEVLVHSNFLVHRTRGATHQEQFVGTRRDRLRRSDDGWRIAGRRVFLNTSVLGVANLQLFF
ncbi:MAG: 3-phenylpropionate/cinnamic acid dioxygenase subunit beta [Actinobacteria bacterium]|nr:3-phenylpropionate/cinnamic acid dioxygenase subunit beta [Actinomycetota bacterium]